MTKAAYWISGALVLVMGTAGAAMARGGPDGGGRGAALFERFDTDGNGQVTRAEVDAVTAAHFSEADADGNGQLSAEEIVAHAESRRNAERRLQRAERMIERLDADGNGLLSATEMAGGREGRLFERLDANSDGAITREEARDARAAMREMRRAD